MSDTSTDLELLLREKEELIDALTERLELTAEQLDRMQRSGGDRGHYFSGGGVPAELIEQQQTLCEDLERVVQQWDDAQPTAALSRIEMQLGEIRDLVAQLSPGSGGGFRESHREEHSSRRASPAEDPQTPDSESGGPAGWEALKAGLLAQGGTDAGTTSYDSPASSGPDPFEAPLPAAPEAVDLDSADRDELRYALLARDEFITELLRRLRAAECRTRPTDGWKSLENVPADLRERLESLERRLEQAHRISEVELSLERAKLGREAARLKQLEESTQKAMERLGVAMAAQEQLEEDEDEPQHDSSPDGRWLRMLGIKREK